jgi:hypothetical protein
VFRNLLLGIFIGKKDYTKPNSYYLNQINQNRFLYDAESSALKVKTFASLNNALILILILMLL